MNIMEFQVAADLNFLIRECGTLRAAQYCPKVNPNFRDIT